MNDTTDLVLIPRETALEVFTTPKALDPYLAKIRTEIDAFIPDISTRKGREACASMALKVAKSKAYLEGVGKALADEAKETPKKIDSARRLVRETLDAWKDEVRAPLTAWEEAEEARVAAHKALIEGLVTEGQPIAGRPATAIRKVLARVEAFDAGERMEEFASEAAFVKGQAIAALTAELAARETLEAEQEELRRLRQEAAQREQQDREARIAREAAESAQRAAEAKAQDERNAAARREAEAAAAAERREQALKLEAEQAASREEQAKREAQEAREQAAKAAEDARLAEVRRQEEAAAEERRQTAAREADKKHKAAVNNAAVEAFITGGMNKDDAMLAVTLIARKAIPAVQIAY